MADLDFDMRLSRMFAEAPALPDGDAFAQRVEAKLERNWTMRRVLIGAAGLGGGLIVAGQMLAPQINQKIEDAVLKAVDIEGMAKDALGKNWATQPSRKRNKFIEAFRGRFKKATGQQLDLYRSAQTKYVGEEKVGDDVKVTTELTVKGEPTRVRTTLSK